MPITYIPRTQTGKWSVGLNGVFVFAISASLVFVLVMKLLSFDDTWWDVTVGVMALTSLTALVCGILAIRKGDGRSFFVIASVVLSVCTVLFGLVHSLFISD